MRLLILASLLSIAAKAETFEELQNLAERQGYANKAAIVQVIYDVASEEGLKPSKMLRIAMLESSLNSSAWRVNKNDTVDVGLFQINSVNFPKCKGLDLNKVRDNVRCAAKLLKEHKRHAKLDAQWLCRYHSKTPSKKDAYCRKLASLN